MHPTVLATQRADAIDRIDQASKTLSDLLHIDSALIDALQPQGKDPQVKELHRLQAVATLLETIAGKSGVVLSNVPGIIEETIPVQRLEIVGETSSPAGVTAVTPDTDKTVLPPPVIEKSPSVTVGTSKAKKPSSRKSKK